MSVLDRCKPLYRLEIDELTIQWSTKRLGPPTRENVLGFLAEQAWQCVKVIKNYDASAKPVLTLNRTS